MLAGYQLARDKRGALISELLFTKEQSVTSNRWRTKEALENLV